MTPASQPLSIAPHHAAKLTPLQKKFNALVKKIAHLRSELKAWDEAEQPFAKRWQAEWLPLQQEGDQLQWALAQQWAEAAQTVTLTERDRTTLQELIVGITAQLLADKRLPAATLQEARTLHDAHSARTHQQLQEEARQQLQAQFQRMFGVTLPLDEIDLENPPATMRRVHAALQQATEQAAEEASPATNQAPNKAQLRREKQRQQREQERQNFVAQASQSVQALFRRLASSLHPDREKDPVERQRKTELMQRATTAYNENRLLDLLQLQFEAQLTDAQALTQVEDQALKHYIYLLEQQIDTLDNELSTTEARFAMRYQLHPERIIDRHALDQIVTEISHAQRQANAECLALLNTTQSDKPLKTFLNTTRQQHAAQTRKVRSSLR